MDADSIIEIRGLRKRFGDLEVLKGIDLTVSRGEVVAIIGRSGSGKSTLLRCINGLEPFQEGTLSVEQQALRTGDEPALRALRQRVGMIFQGFNLLPHLSAGRNVMLAPGLVKGLRGAAGEQRARELLARVGLVEKFDAFADQLSGGQQQRVAIARALANRPKLLLADEPTGNLDPATSSAVFQALYQICREQGVAAVIATHNMELARYMDRVLALKDGHLEAQTF